MQDGEVVFKKRTKDKKALCIRLSSNKDAKIVSDFFYGAV